mgnify:CR=1 FL=1
MLITSYASNSGFADTNAVNVPYKRKAIHLWEYIKAKTDSLYATKEHNHDDRYVKKSGDTMSGVLTIDTPNFGALTIKRNDDANGASIQFRGKSSVYGYIGLNNSTKDK